MKHLSTIFLALLLSVQAVFAYEPERIMLTGDWEFRQVGSQVWNKASVPGCVHTDLLENGLIEDPFYGRNEKSLQWIGEKDWEYRKSFRIEDKERLVSNVNMVLEGVDTYAEISINGLPVGNCDNMFRTWRFDVSDLLKEGENEILIRFESVFKKDIGKYLAAPYRLMAWPNNDQSDIWLSLYARKAGYHYGWDWGPRLITCGLHKPAYIEILEDWRPVGTRFVTSSLERVSVKSGKAGKAMMKALVEVESDIDAPVEITISKGKERVCRKSAYFKKGFNRIECPFTLRNQQLWWCNSHGTAHMEDFIVSIEAAGRTATIDSSVGIRTAEVVREDDAEGRSMKVRLNGLDVFCKGVNWIPIDNFPERRDRHDYEYLIGSAAESNMNMIRVWGGGLYESEDFYGICDSLGVMVWQDMAFACGMFPSDAEYLENVAAEVRDNVRRLRNHPSLVLWCGNNENEISYFEWGWNRTLTPDQRKDYEAGLRKLFYEVIPEAIAQEDETRYYHPTSPVTGHSGVPYSMGDAHMWSVWKGGWVEEYLKPHNIARFMSEYGFISYPDMFSIGKFIPQWDQYKGSPSMLAHHRAYDDTTRDPMYSDKTISRYMSRYAWVPEDFEEYVYMTQWFQAEVVKVAIEAHRRAKPYCMGTLFWQLNDCWPVVSWSSIDYYGRWKALQYYARKAYTPVLASPYLAGDGKVAVKVVSDRTDDFRGVMEAYVMDFDGTVIQSWKKDCLVGADRVEDCLVLSEDLLSGNTFLYVRIMEDGDMVTDNIFFSRYPKDYEYGKPDIRTEVLQTAEGLEITLSTDRLARCLYLYTDNENDNFSDNYFTLVPGFPYKVRVQTDKTVENLYTTLKYQTL